jgi:hypothetical protein
MDDSPDVIRVQAFAIAFVPASPERREQFRAHVAALVEEETRLPGEAHDDDSSEPPPVALGAACGMCRGLCCRYGGNAAHLDAAAIRRVRRLWPELTEADIVARYMSAIPERGVERSCIVHGEHGCTLPRELRSETCNAFVCLPVRNWLERNDPRPTALVVVEDERVIRSGVLQPPRP